LHEEWLLLDPSQKKALHSEVMLENHRNVVFLGPSFTLMNDSRGAATIFTLPMSPPHPLMRFTLQLCAELSVPLPTLVHLQKKES
uniref:KRAB domain-containing protein n=1 Tax=Naja naja TaxID=35670 RepID=A0A8C6V8Q7_NAJNA